MAGLWVDLPCLVLFAQDANSAWLPYIYLLPIPLLFYFMIFRPQQQQERKRRAMIDALKKNDKVLTSAGIYATVVSVDNDHDRVVLRIDDEKGVKVAFSKSSVVRVLEATAEKT